MKCYRMKHVPTGLYYRPVGFVKCKVKGELSRYYKTNLSKKGKVYPNVPTFAWIGRNYYNHLYASEIDQKRYVDRNPDFYSKLSEEKLFPYVPSEWIIEEVA